MDGGGFAELLYYSNNQEYTISNCSFNGDIYTNADSSSQPHIGGFAERIKIDNASVLNIHCCYSQGTFIDKSVQGSFLLGGFSASLYSYLTSKVYISNCHSNYDLSTGANITGQWSGGFIGQIYSVDTSYIEIKQCYSLGDIKIGTLAGGFISNAASYDSSTILIKDCYATGKVTINYKEPTVSCFCGIGLSDATAFLKFQNCYGTGLVTNNGTGGVRGFLGSVSTELIDKGYCTNCFWDIETSGTSLSNGGTGKTTVEMKTQSTFTNWDFDKIWRKFVEGTTYPLLQNKCGCILFAMGYL